jgi:hypothetical protein
LSSRLTPRETSRRTTPSHGSACGRESSADVARDRGAAKTPIILLRRQCT